MQMYNIGEFSTISGIPVRTLRFYHEKGLLVPAAVDVASGYRTYDERNLEVAQVIVSLRRLDFSLDDIREMLAEIRDDDDILLHLEQQRTLLGEKLQQYRDKLQLIDDIIKHQLEARETHKMAEAELEIQERDVEPVMVAGIRMTGNYSDCGKGFAALGKKLGRHIAGTPLCLFYDGEYREGDANFEPCLPVRKKVEADGVTIRELPAAHCVTLLHRGPYEELRHSYARLLKYVKSRGYSVSLPTREVYLKGPGMIFRGNPKKYVTEIQLPIANHE
jgi:DNA-binding transcriptional MerR regulator/effector-binding domain-containing protein